MMEQVTLVMGADAKYFAQFEATFPVWVRYWPILRSTPMVFFYDAPGGDESTGDRMKSVVSREKLYHKPTFWAWNPEQADPTVDYEDQRERMLTAWCSVPPFLTKTQYWLKLDSDAFPTRPIAASFPNPRWLEGSPAIIGHSWHYTKQRGASKGDWFETLDDWGDRHPILERRPGLGLRFPVGSRRLGHERIASYCSFFETEFTRSIMAHNPLGLFKIPVPSQDTFFWYAAARARRAIKRIKMKRHGVSNQSRLEKLLNNLKELEK